jgi:hypothetical protein
MSDYYSQTIDYGPLFANLPKIPEKARSFHERDDAQKAVLARLRNGPLLKVDYENDSADGSRLAPAIEQLRNAYGFSIKGDGSINNPYRLEDVSQRPTKARVTPEMKAVYYTTPHWLGVRSVRFAMDMHRCVCCHAAEELRCHHVSYEKLFNEPLEDLLTLCDRCHGRVHASCRLKFPSGISVQYAHWLGWKGFEEWLLP